MAGVKASFESSLPTSASGCIIPRKPTRFGPMRDWKRPMTLRSASRTIGTSWRKTAKMMIDLAIITSVPSTIRRPPPRPSG